MNLYLISQSVNSDYDTFDSAVVAAPSAEAARLIHPNGMSVESGCSAFTTWCEPEGVDVQLIGRASGGTKQGVICASFNAG